MTEATEGFVQSSNQTHIVRTWPDHREQTCGMAVTALLPDTVCLRWHQEGRREIGHLDDPLEYGGMNQMSSEEGHCYSHLQALQKGTLTPVVFNEMCTQPVNSHSAMCKYKASLSRDSHPCTGGDLIRVVVTSLSPPEIPSTPAKQRLFPLFLGSHLLPPPCTHRSQHSSRCPHRTSRTRDSGPKSHGFPPPTKSCCKS